MLKVTISHYKSLCKIGEELKGVCWNNDVGYIIGINKNEFDATAAKQWRNLTIYIFNINIYK